MTSLASTDGAARASPAADRAALRPAALVVAASLLACAAVPFLPTLPLGVLGEYTDHLRQPSLAWLAATRGIDVYRVPYGELAAGSTYRHTILEWPEVKCIYPPGGLVAFMPLAAVGQWVPMSADAFQRLAALYVLAMVHLALWPVLARLRRLGAVWRVPAVALAWIAFARAGLSGQYEPVWIGAAALMFTALEERRYGAAFRWLALAVLLHYRAVVVVPFGVAAAIHLARTRPPRSWPWKPALLALASGVMSLVCFRMATDSIAAYRPSPPLLATPGDALFVGMVAVGIAGGLAAAASGDAALVACVLAISSISLVDSQRWWHASAVFAPLLAAGAVRAWRRPTFVVAALTAWAFAAQNAWYARPHTLFAQLLAAVSGR